MKSFAQSLIKARIAAGFDSAYKFYHRNGGRRHFCFTFIHYLRIEKGVSLPTPEWLERIFIALRLLPTREQAREILTHYLRDYLGKGADYVLNPLLNPVSPPPDGSVGPMQWMKAHSSIHLTPEEFRVMAASPAAYWCMEALCNDSGAWSPKELAHTLGLAEKSTAGALESLRKAGLAVKSGTGKYRCRHQGKFFTYPGRLEGMGPALSAVKKYWAEAGKTGEDFFERVELIRAEAGSVSNYRLQLAQTMDSANAYATHASGDTSGFFLIETRIRKIKKF
jgi:biotin operon repressor